MTLIMVATSALNVKVMRKQARVNGRRNHDFTSVDVAVWLESTMNRVSHGDRSTSLSFLSCGALQSDEIIGILRVLFRYVGIGTQLALTSMDWMNTREAVILVPRPDRFCARASLVTLVLQDTPPQQYLLRLPQAVRDGQALCHLSRHISQRCSPPPPGEQLWTGKSDVYQ